MSCNAQFWGNPDNVMEFLLHEGNKTSYSRSVQSFFHSLNASLILFNSGRFNRYPLADAGDFVAVDISTFSSSQRRDYFEITVLLQNIPVFDCAPPKEALSESEDESDRESDDEVDGSAVQANVAYQQQVNSTKSFLVYGEAGSGKSYLIRALMQFCLQHHLVPALACPTGKLAFTYSYEFPGVRCDTVHAMFNTPVGDDNMVVNWGLSNVHLLVIDEVTQIRASFIDHIMLTRHSLPGDPRIVFVGDCYQLQPLETNQGRTSVGLSLFGNERL